MNELDMLRKKMDLAELDILKRIYDVRNDKYIFSDTPFYSPEWHGLNDLRPEAQEAERKHQEQFGQHNRFWDDIAENAWRVGLAFSDAVDAFRALKYSPTTVDAYKKVEVRLIEMVASEYQRAKDGFAIKYNTYGEIRWVWRFRYFIYVISGKRWIVKRNKKRLLRERKNER